MITGKTFSFLKKLATNNDRVWFSDNKQLYLEARSEFQDFISALIAKIAWFDKSVADQVAVNCVFRMNRDLRFAKDKSPYHTHFSAHIVEGGRKNETARAGYYIKIEPGNSMLASGAHKPGKDWLKRIRQNIYHDPQRFRKIIHDSHFIDHFGKFTGEKLVRVPAGFREDFDYIDLIKYKSYLAIHPLTDKEVTSGDLLYYAALIFNVAKPFRDFINA